MTILTIAFYLAMLAVIGGHFFFAYVQWNSWVGLCGRITDLPKAVAEQTEFLGRSIASYNASVGLGLALSFLLDGSGKSAVQAVVLVLIIATAMVGARGTKAGDTTILKFRLAPAAVALVLLAVQVFAAPPPAT